MTTPIGIHDLAFATGSRVLDLSVIAERLGTEIEKYTIGIGQERMSITAADEDVVTMGAAAAKQIIDRHGTEGIRTVLFATETGIDQSKAAGVYVHQLLGLPATCRVVELKQACYSATAALDSRPSDGSAPPGWLRVSGMANQSGDDLNFRWPYQANVMNRFNMMERQLRRRPDQDGAPVVT